MAETQKGCLDGAASWHEMDKKNVFSDYLMALRHFYIVSLSSCHSWNIY